MNQAKILADQELAAYTSIYDSVNKELKLLKKIESVRLVRKNGQETLAKAQETEQKSPRKPVRAGAKGKRMA